LPKTPKCHVCPFTLECISGNNGKAKELPVKIKKSKRKHRYFLYRVFVNPEKRTLYLRKRTEKDIWRNLFDFHLQEHSSLQSLKENIARESNNSMTVMKPHILSHQTIHAWFIVEKTKEMKSGFKGMEPVDFNELKEYPLPTLIKNYIDRDLIHLYSLIS